MTTVTVTIKAELFETPEGKPCCSPLKWIPHKVCDSTTGVYIINEKTGETQWWTDRECTFLYYNMCADDYYNEKICTFGGEITEVNSSGYLVPREDIPLLEACPLRRLVLDQKTMEEKDRAIAPIAERYASYAELYECIKNYNEDHPERKALLKITCCLYEAEGLKWYADRYPGLGPDCIIGEMELRYENGETSKLSDVWERCKDTK